MASNRLRRVVTDTIANRLPGVVIDRIDLRHDVDDGGDGILRILIVLRDDHPKLDGRRLVGLVRHLRPRLSDAGTEDFPVITFVSKSEAERPKRVAA